MSELSKASLRKYFAFLTLAQAACVLCGLAFYHLYFISSANRSAKTAAWSAMEPAAEQMAQQLRPVTARFLRADSAPFRVAAASLGTNHDEPTTVAVVDSNWKIIDSTNQPRKTSAASRGKLRAEQVLEFTRSGAARENPSMRGLVLSGGKRHVALAQALAGNDGYLVLYRDSDTLHIATADLPPVLWASDIGVFLWICTIGCVGNYIVVGVWHRDNSAGQQAGQNLSALRQAHALVRTQEAVIFGLAKLTDSRDPNTGHHLDRITDYSSMLAAAARHHEDFQSIITPSFLERIGISAALHDIGKVGVQDAILGKPGPLSAEERSEMKRHTRIGEECLREIERRLGSSNFLQMAREIACAHHERWDGTGYPLGLAGDAIPLAARIVAIADVYDALSSERIYKETIPHDECVAIIADESGKHFDPRLVQVFLSIENRFRKISAELASNRNSNELNRGPAGADADGKERSFASDQPSDRAETLASTSD